MFVCAVVGVCLLLLVCGLGLVVFGLVFVVVGFCFALLLFIWLVLLLVCAWWCWFVFVVGLCLVLSVSVCLFVSLRFSLFGLCSCLLVCALC